MRINPFGLNTDGFIRWMLTLALVAGVASTQAQFQLIDNFQSAKPGNLNGQNGWTATADTVLVDADPVVTGNQAASFGAGAASGYRALSIPQGTTATVFFRAYSTEDTGGLDWFAGMSDVAISGTGVFGDFETQVGVAGAQTYDTLKIRDGSTGGNVNSAEFLSQTWYKFWVVIDNTTDRYEVYMQGGGSTNQTQVDRDDTGSTSFVFRNSGAGPVSNNLVRFFVLTSSSQFLPMLLDDIYLASGKNLSDPTTVGEPSRLAIDRSGGEVAIRWQGNGTLQSSAQAGTGYADVAGAKSPFKVDVTAAIQQFYRLRE